jgi:GT2 family glycosyltransferase
MTTNITMLCANRPRLLAQALDSIGDLDDANLTIRDAGMNPDVARIALRFFAGRVMTVALKQATAPLGTGPARNAVIDLAQYYFGRGDYLCICDDDVFFKPGWLATLVDACEKAWTYGHRVVGGYNHPFNGPIAGEPRVWLGGDHEVYPVFALASQSMLMRWEVWDKYGPFCQTPVGKVCQSEDVDFGNRIRADGFRLGVVSPAVIVNTGITNSFGEKIPGWELVLKEAPAGVLVEQIKGEQQSKYPGLKAGACKISH